MKTLLIAFPLIGLLFAASNGAIAAESKNPGYAFCNTHFSFSSDKTKCLEIVRNRFFDSEALAACKDISFTSVKFDCLNAVAGKGYDEEELKICKDTISTTSRVECLKKGGTLGLPIPAPGVGDGASCPDTQQTRDKVAAALDDIQAGSTNRARVKLERLLDDMRACTAKK